MTAATPAPLSAVLAALRAGAPTLADVADRTGLPPDLVRLAVDRLVAMGRLSAERLDSTCPSGGCGTCPSARAADGWTSTCPPVGTRGAPVLLSLVRCPADH